MAERRHAAQRLAGFCVELRARKVGKVLRAGGAPRGRPSWSGRARPIEKSSIGRSKERRASDAERLQVTSIVALIFKHLA